MINWSLEISFFIATLQQAVGRPGGLNFIPWRMFFVCPQRGTRFVSLFCCYSFDLASFLRTFLPVKESLVPIWLEAEWAPCSESN